jgi:hypothetical protein
MLLLVVIVSPRGALLAQPALIITVDGSAKTVFAHAGEACDANDVPDAPARAIRTHRGVQLYATQLLNRRLVGPDLDHLRQDCHAVYQGAQDDDPAKFDDRTWIASLFTRDGQTIEAIGHNEFWGHRRVGLCPTANYNDCVYNALVALKSIDGGLSFHRASGADALVAALPTRYNVTAGQHVGYFNPTGMVTLNGSQYMMAHATRAVSQQPGNCLLRNSDPADATGWRAWDGLGFNAVFINPYSSSAALQNSSHVCMPIGTGRLRWPVTSLVRHSQSDLFIALMLDGARHGGIYYATSSDLLTWSEPEKLIAVEGSRDWQCGDQSPVAYPSLLDSRSSDWSFETIGGSATLFMSLFNPTDCHLWMNRDLISMPVNISKGVHQ